MKESRFRNKPRIRKPVFQFELETWFGNQVSAIRKLDYGIPKLGSDDSETGFS